MTMTNDGCKHVASTLRAYNGRDADVDAIGEIMAVIIGASDVDGWS